MGSADSPRMPTSDPSVMRGESGWGQRLAVHFCPLPVVLTRGEGLEGGQLPGWCPHTRSPPPWSQAPPGPHPSIMPHLDPLPTLGPPPGFRSWGQGGTPLPSDPQPGFNLAPSGCGRHSHKGEDRRELGKAARPGKGREETGDPNQQPPDLGGPNTSVTMSNKHPPNPASPLRGDTAWAEQNLSPGSGSTQTSRLGSLGFASRTAETLRPEL